MILKPISSVQVGQFQVHVEGKIRSEMQGGFMTDSAYTELIKNAIVVCSDCIIINRERKTLYLVKRIAKPMQGLWFIGGRRRKGETPVEGMRRCFERETGIDVTPERFQFVTITEYIWQDCQQKPQEMGSHTMNHQFVVELTDDEILTISNNLHPKEYDPAFGLQEFDRDAIYADSICIHPIIMDVYNHCFPV